MCIRDRSIAGEEEVLVLAPSDVDMAMHDGQRVRVHGTLVLSTSTGIQMLLLPDGKDPREAVVLCNQHVQRRQFAEDRIYRLQKDIGGCLQMFTKQMWRVSS